MRPVDRAVALRPMTPHVVRKAETLVNDRSELQLIEAARTGDREAFNRLVQSYHKPLLGFIRGKGVRESDCEDVAQEVWTRVWRKIGATPAEGGYNPEKGGFYTWVAYCFARYRIRDCRARERARQVVAADDPRMEEPAQPPFDPTHEEQLRRRLAAFAELLRVTFLCGGYPHEQLAFGFTKLIYGSRSRRAVEGLPRYVSRRHGAEPLDQLTRTFVDQYASVSEIDDAALAELLPACIEPVRLRSALTVMRLIRPLPKHLHPIKDECTGQTCLRQYYTGDPDAKGAGTTHPITHWCHRVSQKVRRVLGVDADADPQEMLEDVAGRTGAASPNGRVCRQCKLRSVPPCEQGARQT